MSGLYLFGVTGKQTVHQNAAAANGNGLLADVQGCGVHSVQVVGTFDATVHFEATVDGTNWIAIQGANQSNGALVSQTTAAGVFSFAVSGRKQFRVRVADYVSGSVTATGFSLPGNIGIANALPAGASIIGQVGIDQTTPGTTNGVQVNAALPAGDNNIGNIDVLTIAAGDNNIGNVDLASAVPAGANIIGKVGIDQTTPGTTNAVQVAAALPAGANNIGDVDIASALPAGANLIGKVGIDQTTPGTTNGVQVNAELPAGTQNIGDVDLASEIPAGTQVIGKVGIDQTTPGTTNGVQVNAALPAGSNNIGDVDILTIAAGANIIGKVGIDQTTPGTTNGVQVVAALPAGANNIGDVDILSIAAGNNNIGDVDIASIAAGDNNIGNVDVLSIAAGDNNIGNVDIVSTPFESTPGQAVPGKAVAVGASDGTNLQIPRVASADGLSGGSLLGAVEMAQNAAGTYDAKRRNLSGTLLASAARTAATPSADQTNYNASKLIVYLRITAASGTGGLSVQVQGKDPISGTYYQINANPAAVITTGLFTYQVALGLGAITGDITQNTNAFIPDIWRVNVAVGDASENTYSVGYSLVQ